MNVNTFNSQETWLTVSNIEALADSETDGEHNFQIGEKTITNGRKYSTTVQGWKWDIGLQVWLFNGKVSKGQPGTFHEDSSSEVVKIKCCRAKGPEKDCWYETC